MRNFKNRNKHFVLCEQKKQSKYNYKSRNLDE